MREKDASWERTLAPFLCIGEYRPYSDCVHDAADEVRRKYDELARTYDWKNAIVEYLHGIGGMRKNLLSHAHGRVLEVAVGTGRNFPYYPKGCSVVGVDLSEEMLRVARKRAARLHIPVELHRMDAEDLPFPDRSFDTVVSSLSLCSFPSPAKVLHEMKRVCRGSMLFLEHGRSNHLWLGSLQDRFAGFLIRRACCHWNREPHMLICQAGIPVCEHERRALGVLHAIRCDCRKNLRGQP
jgi:ubiquinone/menaquinone biosynthesis C-methylase UbiE